MKSILLLDDNDVKTYCDETGLPRNIWILLLVATGKQPYWKYGQLSWVGFLRVDILV